MVLLGPWRSFCQKLGIGNIFLFKHLATMRVISNSGIASIQAIKKKENPVVTVSDGEKVLQIIEAARKSADQYGQVVYV